MPTKNEPFSKSWQTAPFKRRVVNFFINPTPDQDYILAEFMKRMRSATNQLSHCVHQMLLSDEINKTTLKQSSLTFPDVLSSKNAEYLCNHLGLHHSRLRRSAAFRAVQFYTGYFARNTKLPKRAPLMRQGKSVSIKDGIASLKDDKLVFTIQGPKGENKIALDFWMPKKMREYLPHLVKNWGGNLRCKKGKFIFAASGEIPYKWLYSPETELAFDLNATPEWFITFNKEIELDGERVSRVKQTKVIRKYRERLKKLNELINDETLKSSQRRAVRNKWFKAHNDFEKVLVPVCLSLVNYARDHKALLCIDDLTCGASTGSFGQDKIRNLLQTYCEEMGVPFIIVPTPYTSKVCSKCGFISEDRPRPDKITFECCGAKNAHLNGAENIAKWGRMIWDVGMKDWYVQVIKPFRDRKKKKTQVTTEES